nr:MAG TPA: E2F-associated phosphoprotein [Caudoviricetes sp.]
MKILIILPHLIFIILSTPNTSCSSCMNPKLHFVQLRFIYCNQLRMLFNV